MTDRETQATLHREKVTAACLSLISNLLLTVVKLMIGISTGSVSVLSDGAHSASDVMASGLAFYAVQEADRPPDKEHPYGHGKMESLSSLIQAALLFGAGLYIIYEAILHLRRHEGPQRLDWGMGIMLVSALLNVFIVRFVSRAAKHTDSEALHAAAQDHRADIYTALGVFIGLTLVRLTGKIFFDPVFALCVALLIFHGAWIVIRDAMQHLMDTRLPDKELEAVRQVFVNDPNALGYHKLKTRRAGSTRYVDAHVLMEDSLTLVKAHELTEELETKIREALPNSIVTLHTEPYHHEREHQKIEHGGPPPDEIITSSLSKK